MQHLNPNGLYILGYSMRALTDIKEGAKLPEIEKPLSQAEAVLEIIAAGNVMPIKDGTPILEKSAPAAKDLIESIGKLVEVLFKKQFTESQEGAEYEDLEGMRALIKILEVALAFDLDRSPLFLLEKQGIYDTLDLVERAEKRFPKSIRKVLPPLTISDLNQAGKCLAFELPTACAFHVCRGTEALMLAYYEALTSQAWPYKKRDWNMYNDQLAANGAPKAITNRLGEIRADRNAYAHPDITVPLDEASVVFELCGGVIHLMAKEVEKLEVAKTAASSPSIPSLPA